MPLLYCLRCGYNLSKTRGRSCPECGAPFHPRKLQESLARQVIRPETLVAYLLWLPGVAVLLSATQPIWSRVGGLSGPMPWMAGLGLLLVGGSMQSVWLARRMAHTVGLHHPRDAAMACSFWFRAGCAAFFYASQLVLGALGVLLARLVF